MACVHLSLPPNKSDTRYTEFNEYNDALFNIRARSLNNLVYWFAQILGSILIGFLLDRVTLPRRTRAFTAWIILLAMVFIVHTWAYFYQRCARRSLTSFLYCRTDIHIRANTRKYTRESLPPDSPDKYDIFTHGYTGRIFLYIFCGLLDSMWQTTSYWIIGAMSNDPAKLAYFAGFYKSIQSAGGAGSWAADAQKTP